MQYGARQLGCTKVQVHSYPDEPSHGARCSSAPVVTRSPGPDDPYKRPVDFFYAAQHVVYNLFMLFMQLARSTLVYP